MKSDQKKIFIAGHNGMVGSAIKRNYKKCNNIEIISKNKADLDLTNQESVNIFFKDNHVDEVYIAAAKVGGIHANNTFPADFISKNLQIQTNLINSAWKSGINKLLFLGSSCIYPKNSNQPIKIFFWSDFI